MRRNLVLAGVAVMVGAILALWGGGLVRDAGSMSASRTVTIAGDRPVTIPEELKRAIEAAQPDTKAPNWKQISKDVGLQVRRDERFGVRGRLFVRVDGKWYPVLMEGPSDLNNIVPAG